MSSRSDLTRRRSPEPVIPPSSSAASSSSPVGGTAAASAAAALKKIDVSRERYPFCVVWTPIPLLSWLLPMIGHMGICDSNGIIHDFGGSFYISEDSMLFGNPVKYWDISHLVLPTKKSQGGRLTGVALGQGGASARDMIPLTTAVAPASSSATSSTSADTPPPTALSTFSALYGIDLATAIANYDTALQGTTDFFRATQHYNFFTNNCHSFVAYVLESAVTGKQTSSWNMVKLTFYMMVFGRYVSVGRFLKAHLPFLVLVAMVLSLSLGLTVGRK